MARKPKNKPPSEPDDGDEESQEIEGGGDTNGLAELDVSSAHAFIRTLGMLDGGRGIEQVAKQSQTLVLALKERAKLIKGEAKGTLTFTISYDCDDDGAIALTYRSEIKLPRRKGQTTVLYASDDGNLVPDDPRQPMLPGLAPPEAAKGRTFLTDRVGNVVS